MLLSVRTIALSLPEVNERMSHGAPCFFVRGKLPLRHPRDGRISPWHPAAPDVQDAMLRIDQGVLRKCADMALCSGARKSQKGHLK